MKKIFIILTALLAHTLAAEDPNPASPFEPGQEVKPETGPSSLVSRIHLDSHHNANDAIKQIIAGLPPEGRKFFVVDVPEEELAKMPITGELDVRNVPIPGRAEISRAKMAVRLQVPEQRMAHQQGARRRHHCSELQDIERALGGTRNRDRAKSDLHDEKKGRCGHPKANGSPLTPLSPLMRSAIRMRAAHGGTNWKCFSYGQHGGYHEEFSAVILLKERGYDSLSLEH